MTTAVGHNWAKRAKSLIAMLALAFAQVASGVTHQMDCSTGGEVQFDARLSVGDKLALVLPGNERFCLELVEAEPSKLGGEAFLGRVEGSDGLLTATVVRGKKGMKITFTSPTDGRIYVIRSTARGMCVRKVNPADFLSQPSPSLIPERRPTGRRSRVLRRAQNGGPVTVDVMVAYEKGAQEWLDGEGQDAETFAQSAVTRMNAALANTGLSSSFRFRLVGTLPVNARGSSLNAVLNAVTEGTGAWQAVSTYRDEVGADIVTTLIDTGSASGSTGLGWSLTDAYGTGDYSGFADWAYNVCSIRSVEISHTMTHEVGHNMGAGHSDLQSTQAGPQLFNYSSGYYFTANGKPYHTIMAYYTDGRSDVFYEEVPFFSSPLHTYEGVAVGNSTHDNTLTLKRTFEQVADFRAAKTDPGEEPEPEPELETLTWYRTKTDAFTAAEASGKRILLVYGRDTCNNTTATRNFTCEDPAVKVKLFADYVLWYSNCDTQSSESYRYLTDDYVGYLPGVSVIDPVADRAIVGVGGYQNVSSMLALLARAEAIPRTVRYSISYVLDGGENDAANPTDYTVYDLPIELSAPSKPGMTFDGWLLNGVKVTELPAGTTGNLTLTATWEDSAVSGDYEWAYRIEDGGAIIDGGWYKCAVSPEPVGEVVVPSTLGGCPVVEIGQTAFAYCGKITSVVLPSTVKRIGYGAFQNCSKLRSISLPEGLQTINGVAFANAPIETLTIPATVETIDSTAFAGCEGDSVGTPLRVLQVRVAKGNRRYEVDAGLLYDCDDNSVIWCSPSATAVVVREGTTAIGSLAFSACGLLSSVHLPNTLCFIDSSAFYQCCSLESVEIPRSVEIFGGYVFSYCTALEDVFFAGNAPYVDADYCNLFYGTPETLTCHVRNGSTGWDGDRDSVALPDAWPTGDDYARSIDFRTDVPEADRYAITYALNGGENEEDCPVGYSEIDLPLVLPSPAREGYVFGGWLLNGVKVTELPVGTTGNVTLTATWIHTDYTMRIETVNGQTWRYYLVDGKAVIGIVDEYGNSWWSGERAVSPDPVGELVIPSRLGGYVVSGIGNYALYNASAVTKVTIPAEVKRIGEYAFWCCSMLPDVTLPEGLVEIGSSAFYYCGLRSVSLPRSLERLGDGVFGGCYSLKTVKAAADSAFFSCEDGVLFSKDGQTLYFSPPDRPVSIPQGVRKVVGSAFMRNSWNAPMEDGLSLPSSVTNIGDHAFYGHRFKTVSLNEGLVSIGSYVFSECGFAKVEIPSTVRSLGSCCFCQCPNLRAIAFHGDEPDTQAPLVDDGCAASVTIYVRASADGWRDDGGALVAEWPAEVTWAVPCPVDTWDGSMPEYSISYVLEKDAENDAGNPVCYIRESLPLPLLEPTRPYYSFRGWSLNGRAVTEIPVGMTGDLTLKALWEETPAEPGWGWSDGRYTWHYETAQYYDPKSGGYKTGARIYANRRRAVIPKPKGDLVVPMTIDGMPVVEVDAGAFMDCDELTSVTLPSTFAGNYLDGNAFEGCDNLRSISVTGGGLDGEFNCRNGLLMHGNDILVICPPGLATATIPASTERVIDLAFAHNRQLSSVELPAKITEIPSGCFQGCTRLSRVVCRGKIQTIGRDAFRNCESLYDLGFVPAGATYEANPFQGTGWTSRQGEFAILWNRLLLYQGQGGAVTVPGNVTEIGEEAFCGSDVTSVTVPQGIRSIGDRAFSECWGLLSISGCQGVSEVGSQVLWGTPLSTNSGGLILHNGLVFGYEGEVGDALTVPEGARVICASFLRGDLSLADLSLPKSLQFIGEYAFSDCANLSKVAFGGGRSNVRLSRGAFFGTPYIKSIYPFYDSPIVARDKAKSDGKLLFVLSGADWCPYTSIVKEYLYALGDAFFDRFVVYYCNVDDDKFNMAEGVPSYGIFDPKKFNVNWWDGRLAHGSGGRDDLIRTVIDDGLKAAKQAPLPVDTDPDPVIDKPEPVIDEPDPVNDDDEATLTVPKAKTMNGIVMDLDGKVVGVVQVKLAKEKVDRKTGALTTKASATVTGLDGKKKTAKAVTVELSSTGPTEVTLDVKVWGKLHCWVSDEDFEGTLGDGYDVVAGEVGGNWTRNDACVSVGFDDALDAIPGEVQRSLLPSGEPVYAQNGKWAFDKASGVKVKSTKDKETKEYFNELIVDEGRDGSKSNHSGIKLTYTPKTGGFKGSFKIYAVEENAKTGKWKLKKYTVSVTGLVVDGVGYGIAICKKPPASWPITIE